MIRGSGVTSRSRCCLPPSRPTPIDCDASSRKPARPQRRHHHRHQPRVVRSIRHAGRRRWRTRQLQRRSPFARRQTAGREQSRRRTGPGHVGHLDFRRTERSSHAIYVRSRQRILRGMVSGFPLRRIQLLSERPARYLSEGCRWLRSRTGAADRRPIQVSRRMVPGWSLSAVHGESGRSRGGIRVVAPRQTLLARPQDQCRRLRVRACGYFRRSATGHRTR